MTVSLEDLERAEGEKEIESLKSNRFLPPYPLGGTKSFCLLGSILELLKCYIDLQCWESSELGGGLIAGNTSSSPAPLKWVPHSDARARSVLGHPADFMHWLRRRFGQPWGSGVFVCGGDIFSFRFRVLSFQVPMLGNAQFWSVRASLHSAGQRH